MFIRKKRNKSGVISVQVLNKAKGKNYLLKTIGSSDDVEQLRQLEVEARLYIDHLKKQYSFDFLQQQDQIVFDFLQGSNLKRVRVVGPELVLGSIYDDIGFNAIANRLLRHLVITRLVYPGSKLKTVDYLFRYKGFLIGIDTIYRFLDKLNITYKQKAEAIALAHTKRILNNNIAVVFYDLTTLYFEASDEDDFRKAGFSKDGKAQNPQIILALLVGLNGYPIGYELFEGNTFEGKTFIPMMENIQKKYQLSKPIVVADAGLLSKDNIEKLKQKEFEFILGARIKNETGKIKEQLLKQNFKDGKAIELLKSDGTRLIVSYAANRARKDAHNRKRGLVRLERQMQAGKLSKSHINNRGYNKYLKLTGEITIEIDYEKFKSDNKWDGLKGYITNSKLKTDEVINNYKQLWQIEKAFRISKTDLRVRPIYHHLKRRIQAHISIAFIAYTVYKELERILNESKSEISVQRAIQLTQTIYEIDAQLPLSKKTITIMINLDDEQTQLLDVIQNRKFFAG